MTEKQTANVRPLSTSYGVQVIVGTAPIHLTAHPEQAVNKPILLNSWEEAKEKCLDTRNDGICILCVRVCTHPGNLFQVYPAVFINVLDPERHSKDSESKNYPDSESPGCSGAGRHFVKHDSDQSGKRSHG